MQINNFKDMYIAELQEVFSMEGQFAAALEKMADVATHPTLKTTLLRHRDALDVQMQRLESILQKHGADPSTHTDQAMQMLVVEAANMLSMLNENNLRDA